jgi:tripartite-type tricarboxylate transporter receptor subunit TctC
VVNPSVPASSVKELIALAKQKPGQLIFVDPGIGSTAHMSSETNTYPLTRMPLSL